MAAGRKRVREGDLEEDKAKEERVKAAKLHLNELRKTVNAIRQYAPHGLSNKEEKDKKLAYQPRAGKSKQGILYNSDGEKKNEYKTFPLRFIPPDKEAEGGIQQGAKNPSAVRLSLFNHEELNELILKLNEGDEPDEVLCTSDGNFTSAKNVDMEHFKSNKRFMDAQADLIEYLNKDEEFRKEVLKEEGADKFFIELKIDGGKKYFGTLYFYELGYNNICNLWLMCHACNVSKSSQELTDWLEKSPFYGEDFIEYAKRENAIQDKRGMLSLPVEQLRGLTQKWLVENYKEFISASKKVESVAKKMRSEAANVKEGENREEVKQKGMAVEAGAEIAEESFNAGKDAMAAALKQGGATPEKVAEELPGIKEKVAEVIAQEVAEKFPESEPPPPGKKLS